MNQDITNEEFDRLKKQSGEYAVNPAPPERSREDVCRSLLWQYQNNIYDDSQPEPDTSSFVESALYEEQTGDALFFNEAS